MNTETAPTLPRTNAHIHLPPNFSAFDTATEALDQAAGEGIRALGASNYYDYSVYADFAQGAAQRSIVPLYGLEVICLIDELVEAGVKINDPGNPGKMYLCGKGLTRFADEPGAHALTNEGRALLRTIREQDSARMAEIAVRLSRLFGEAGLPANLEADQIKQRVARRHGCDPQTVYLQERHLAQAFQEEAFTTMPEADKRADLFARTFGLETYPADASAVKVQNDIRSYLMKAGKPAFVPDTFVGFAHARRLILAMGGIPVYPTLADGASPICPFEADVNDLIAELQERGIVGAEFVPVRNSVETLRCYVPVLRAAGLFVTAGTEHNTLDRIPLTPTCLNGEPIPDDIASVFYEGTCVVAAHQERLHAGQPGFVNTEGVLNPEHASDDARIRTFAEEGARLLTAER